MHNDTQEMKALMARMPIPEPASNLESRILAAAKPRTFEAVRGGGWLNAMWHGRSQKLAFAASLALLAVIVLQSPSRDAVSVESSQVIARADSAVERYTVDGTPLLQDIEVNEDTEWYMAEIASDTENAL